MRTLFSFIVLACCCAAAHAQALFGTVDGAQPVRVQSAQMRTHIAAGMAHTTLRLEVFNPNPRQLEATLQLPLTPAQQVSGFALDINGVLRPAVPVDKARGQQVFEAIQRQRVDPALLEHTAGNHFRLRIYPVPAGGTRLVEVSIIEALAQRDGAWLYRPPLKDLGTQLAVDIAVDGAHPPVVKGRGPAVEATGRGYRLRHDGDADFEVRVPRGHAPQLMVQEFDGERFFLAQVPVAQPTQAAPMPRVLGLLWDSSGSGAKRKHAAELEVLGHYLRTAGNIEVQLVRLRDIAEAARAFRIVDGEWSGLRAELERTVYDGGTSLGGIPRGVRPDAWLLVSDGLHNYGSSSLPSNRPVHVLNSMPAADMERLSGLAARSGGVVADLSTGLPAADAAALLVRGRQPMPEMSVVGARDIVHDPSGVQDGWLRIAGRVEGKAAVLTLQRGGEDIELALDGGAQGFAALAWARYRLHRLGAEHDRHTGEIRQLGRRFGIPTRTTSLIVLETLQDYVRHDIVPPADFRDAFMQLRARADKDSRRERATRIDAVARAFAGKVTWWNTRFTHAPPPPKPVMLDKVMEPPVQMSPSSSAVYAPPPELEVAVKRERRVATGIRLQPWVSNAPYMARMRRASTDRLYAVYLEEKLRNPDSTAFFLDAADLMLQRGQRMLALRVMSNVAEMELGNRHVLRVLGYRLMQANAPGLALPLFQKVRELAPEEPQSFRDLGLAQAAAGQPQQAIETLYEVVTGRWDDRFADVELVALAELNAIVARTPKLNTSRFDRRLMKNLPLDLRVVLGWDADNSDMDLHVTDPNGEVAFYGQRQTYQGGRMSDDFTGGYGPEEFSLRRAKPGIYKVHVNFYGHNVQSVVGAPTLQVHFFSGFGTPAERRKAITLRLEGRGEHVFVGEFEVK